MIDLAYRREVVFRPGYNHRGTDRGVHGMEIHFRFYGPEGMTQFMMNAGWVPGESMPASLARSYPAARDLGYHWLTPRYEGQDRLHDCPFLPGGRCYYDGSASNADPVLEAFLHRGEPAVWRALVRFYREVREGEAGGFGQVLDAFGKATGAWA